MSTNAPNLSTLTTVPSIRCPGLMSGHLSSTGRTIVSSTRPEAGSTFDTHTCTAWPAADDVLDAIDAFLAQVGDMNQPIAFGADVHERAEQLNLGHRALELLPDLKLLQAAAGCRANRSFHCTPS